MIVVISLYAINENPRATVKFSIISGVVKIYAIFQHVNALICKFLHFFYIKF